MIELLFEAIESDQLLVVYVHSINYLGKATLISDDNVLMFVGEDETLFFIDIDHISAIEIAETNFPLEGLPNG
jgi:hypothetical protein